MGKKPTDLTLMERIIYAVEMDDHETAEALVDLGNYLEEMYSWAVEDYVGDEGSGI